MMQIEFLDGPLAGTVHEVAGGWPVPDRIGLPEGSFQHWYIIDDKNNTAKYDNSEPRREP